MKTIALVIGNNDYPEHELDNAINDAKSVKEEFQKLGYEVIYIENGKNNDIPILLDEFFTKLKDFDASLFFFAGHGFENRGENYLAFTECPITGQDTPAAFKYSSIKLSELFESYKIHENKVNIVIIDACRKSFERGGANIASSPVMAPKGTLVAFSTSPMAGASDLGGDNHSIYTSALLKYIGRERLSVEDLFKKVRKYVYAATNGKQITWEHTSLIGDFYFNTGQMVFSLDIPYDEMVVKDEKYKFPDDFGSYIKDLKSYNWPTQSDALKQILNLDYKTLNKNQKFIFGRNILQCAIGGEYGAKDFLFEFDRNGRLYNDEDGENHILNGILFEIYFNKMGEFRGKDLKSSFKDIILPWRKIQIFKKSFEFICNILEKLNNPLLYIPKSNDQIVDVIVIVESEIETINYKFEKIILQKITNIIVNGQEIISAVHTYDVQNKSEEDLKDIVSHIICAPRDLIEIHSPFEIKNIQIDSANVTVGEL